jgi:hypothetical protein
MAFLFFGSVVFHLMHAWTFEKVAVDFVGSAIVSEYACDATVVHRMHNRHLKCKAANSKRA